MKSVPFLAVSVASIITLAGCANPEDSESSAGQSAEEEVIVAEADLNFLSGGATGKATLTTAPDSASLNIEIDGLVAGTRGFHLHQTGVCDAPDFKSAGGHLNPLDKSHGTLSEGGSHLGDLPNLVTTDGETTSLSVDIPGEAAQLNAWLFDADGTAIVIHEGPDDYKTDPSGAAGTRIACGVLKQI